MNVDLGWPKSALLKDIVLTPLDKKSNKFWMSFGANNIDESLLHLRGGRPIATVIEPIIDVEPSRRINRTAIYAGPLFRHFGHFIAEGSHRIWPRIVDASLSDAPLAYHTFGGQKALPSFISDTLACYGVKDSDLIFIDEVTHFDELVVPTRGDKWPGKLYILNIKKSRKIYYLS